MQALPHTTMVPLADAYEHCRRVTRQEARNFFYAFLTLPAAKRRAIYAVYAFCRLCDDAVDEVASIEDKQAALKSLSERLDTAYEADAEGPVFTALIHAAITYHIPRDYFREVIRGVEMDLETNRYQTFEDLRQYCYRVASVVGLICLEIFGYRHPNARWYAIDLGLAMQLTNILRDIQEDLARDRIYIPQDELLRFGYTEEDLRNQVRNDAQQRLITFQVQRAQSLFQSGARLLPYLSNRSRACPAVLAAIYTRILRRIQANDYNVFDGRISLSSREKLLVMTMTWLKSLLPLRPPKQTR